LFFVVAFMKMTLILYNRPINFKTKPEDET
jgi:hypothetical protein